MSTNNVCTQFNERYYSKLPIKTKFIHTKCNQGKRVSSCYSGNQEESLGLESKGNVVFSKQKEHIDRGTQMSIKNFYDSFILDGLLNVSDIKNKDPYATNMDGTTDERDPLIDIKNILLSTNDKLDLILNTLADKKEQLLMSLCKDSSRQKKYKFDKHKKSFSYLSLDTRKDDEMSEFSTLSCPWTKCFSNTCITRLRPNPYISPYFPPYHVKPTSHYNYFKIFGQNYSDPDIMNNLWSPFMFMATSFNIKKLQNELSNMTIGHAENENICINTTEENDSGTENHDNDNVEFLTCRESEEDKSVTECTDIDKDD